MDPEWMFVGPADAEHPAVALAAPDRAAHLVGQGLERALLVGTRECAGDRAIRPTHFHRLEKACDRRFVAALHQIHEPGKRDQARLANPHSVLDLEAVESTEEQGGANALVQVLAVAPEIFDLRASFDL